MSPKTLMKIGDNIEVLKLRMNLTGQESVIHPVLLWDSEGATLVDTGVPGQLDALTGEIEAAGVSLGSIRRVILTHQDLDHIGGLPEITQVVGGRIEVWAHEEDKPYIEGDKPLIKMNRERMTQMMESLPEAQQQQIEQLLSSPPSSKVDKTLEDGEELPIYDGGVEVIYTPGHTPGHVSLFVKEEKLLIAGDELRVEQGELVGPSEPVTPDMETANASLEKLADYDIDHVICYHGGYYGTNASERIKELIPRVNGR